MANLRIQGDTSGYIDIAAPDVADGSTIDLGQVPQLNQANTFQQFISNETGYRLTNSGTQISGIFPERIITGSGTSDNLCLFTETGYDFNVMTGGTIDKKLTVSPEGYVTTPNQPFFRVKTDYSSHTTLNGSPNWSNIGENIGNHFSNNTFTAPINGKYFFSVHSLIDFPTANSGYVYIEILVNGGRVAIVHSDSNGITNYTDLSLNHVTSLAANDTVTVNCYCSGSNGWYAGPAYNHFYGYLIG